MFLHNLIYELKIGLREKDLIFWLMIFPVILGTLFKIAFGGIYEKTHVFSTIPTAVVETAEDAIFRTVIDTVTEGDEPLLSVTYADEETALQLLKDGEVEGIIYTGEALSLTVAGEGVEETILQTFLEQYSVRETIIRDVLTNDPLQAEAVITALSEEVSTCTPIPLTEGNTDNFIQYFYNLIAIVALYGSITGLHITVQSQANLSPLGARKSCSPTPKSVSLAAGLIGSYLVQAVCMLICVSYLAFVLKIDFGDRLPFVYLAAILGGTTGVSLGFFVGSLNQFGFEAKVGISMAVSMLCCFLSGLMVGNMKALIAQNLPWVNNINPAAIISDSFYCLNIYSDYTRFTEKIVSMLVLSVVFTVLGFVLTRRKKYASL